MSRLSTYIMVGFLAIALACAAGYWAGPPRYYGYGSRPRHIDIHPKTTWEIVGVQYEFHSHQHFAGGMYWHRTYGERVPFAIIVEKYNRRWIEFRIQHREP